MNFDRISHLASYFHGDQHIPKPPPTDRFGSFDALIPSNAMSDWGIEETLSNPSTNTPFLHFQKPLDDLVSYPQSHDFNYYYNQTDISLPPTTQNLSKYIKKYLHLRLNGEFWDKFKYNLIVSNLLDDSMILSKNEQALNSLSENSHKFVMRNSVFYRILNSDGSQLVITKDYNLQFPNNYYYKNHVLSVVYLVIYLLKQKFDQKLDLNTQMNMFKVLLIIATKFIKFKRVYTIIQMNKILNKLNEFLINNFKINKKIILNLVNLKNLKLFHGAQLAEFFSQLNGTLDFLIFNVKFSIIKLLPNLNGPMFERYCTINNINLDFDEDEEDPNDPNNDINKIVAKINKFNEYRKFLICQLLTIDERPEKNFFISKIIDKFGLNDLEFEMNELTNVSNFEKLLILEEFFTDHNKILENFQLLFEKFEKINNLNLSLNLNENEDILKLTSRHQNQSSNANLNQLILKLSNLTINMRFFQKYNQSTIENNNELSEKITILSQFSDDLNAINELYRLNLQEFKHSANTFENDELISNSSNSNRNSRNSGEFNLKSFHTRHKKAFSGSSNKSPQLPLRSPNPDDDSSKKLSSGLKLGLLTVFEDENKNSHDKLRKSLKMLDDNSDFNQITLDSLSRRKAGRFSINSLNSNVSGLSEILTSTQGTSFDEDDNSLSKDDLKLKLEESLNKIYNLENQVRNQEYQGSIDVDARSNTSHEDRVNEDINMNETTISRSFLDTLETTLNR
ncbi:hypothetical protein PSN45_000039 [Yamadazyma tenuis]|uniref:Myosin-binding domain-containing protein n=1 Tax=Candida tenuis (strain ATCC 10573 / BCRC 21748 / CBS 615 / JCM 9827 / NBRC 10315 / NRRL Y-1498 / VKM Y-70) TaxID=590646 RepID=G3BA07_CANTC|nr:uncharacterized protein CANTEDRAFT_94278 [Yamadazyma tenuis ATCC 10573]EGV61369.1 hypothetical protein CANTEDRAFT_94278 [Yamadazyma tenuis ATCC 10573]WEJ92586.1 hypothetical protein PSN45_000039 [Yamadazyma tenuis]